MLLNNQCITEEIQKNIKKYLETNEYESMHIKTWDAAKAVLRRKFIAKKMSTLKSKKDLKQFHCTPQGTRK